MCDSHTCFIVTRFSKFSLEMKVLLISYSILPLVPTECDVSIVCIRQHNDREWRFKKQHAKMWGKYCGGEKILSPPWFQHCRGERPRRSDASVWH